MDQAVIVPKLQGGRGLLATFGPVAAYVALCVIWGSTYLAIRVSVQSIPPLLMVGTRSVIAGACMAGFAIGTGTALPGWPAIRRASLSGALLFLGGQALLAIGEQRVPSGQAAVLGAMMALFLPFASWTLGEDVAPSRRTLLALLVGFAGVAVLVRPGTGVLDAVGGAIVLASIILWSYGGAVSRRYPATPSVVLTSGLQMMLGGLACLMCSVADGEWRHFALRHVTPASWLAFAYLVAVGSMVGFSAFAWLVRIWPPQRLATYTYVNPIVALGLGAAIAGETLTAREGVATLLVLGAVGVVMTGKRAR